MSRQNTPQTLENQPTGPVTDGRILGAAAFLTLPIAMFASKGLVPLYAVVFVLLLGRGLMRPGGSVEMLKRLPMPISGAVAAFLALAVISTFWSISPGDSASGVWQLALACIGGLVVIGTAVRLNGADRTFFETALIAGGVLGFILLGTEMLTNAALTRTVMPFLGQEVDANYSYTPRLNAAMSVAVLYVWPWLLAVRRRYGGRTALVAIVIVGAIVIGNDSESPILGFVIGVLAAAATAALPGLAPRAVAMALVLSVAAMPLLPDQFPDPKTQSKEFPFSSRSALHRIGIWQTTAGHIDRRPVLGAGFNTARAFYGRDDRKRETYAADDPPRSWIVEFEPIPLHPHNGILQIWLELGGVGAAVFLAALLMGVRLIDTVSSGRVDRGACYGLMASGIAIFSLSFGAWQGWWQVALWMIAAFMAAIVGPRRKVPDVHVDVSAATEIGGPKGPEPTRFGDWEKKGRCIDF